MSYMHIENLYKNQVILLFRECYALEKIHGSSAHISWNGGENNENGQLTFFAGGAKHNEFVALFNQEALSTAFRAIGLNKVVVFGEAYGGKMQGMSATYGKQLRFVAFEVKIDDNWLAVPQAEDFVKKLGLEFVYYTKIPTTIEAIDAAMLMPSMQSQRNGMGDNNLSEGIVLRPPIEVKLNNGERVIAKHKNEKFHERQHQPKPLETDKFEVLQKAEAIADEWVTEMRLTHVLDAFPDAGIEKTGEVIKAMIEDIEREAKGEIIESREARAAIGKKTAKMFKNRVCTILLKGRE